jgi:hypothetical protein
VRSISTGLVKPNSRIEAAICATCWSLCVRAFLAKGTQTVGAGRNLAEARQPATSNVRAGR